MAPDFSHNKGNRVQFAMREKKKGKINGFKNSKIKCIVNLSSSVSTSDVLGDLLALPQPKITKKKRKPGFNQKAVCITDDKVLQDLEEKKEEKK